MSVTLTTEAPVRHLSGLSRISRLCQLMGAGFAAHWMFYAIGGLYAAVAWIFVFRLPGADLFSAWKMLRLFVVVAIPAMLTSALLGLAVYRFYHVMATLKSERPLLDFIKVFKNDVLDVRRYVIGVPMFIAVFIFMCIFEEIKTNIPAVNPYSWDETFMFWDKWLHFGQHPWEWLQPIIGYPIVTFVISKFYAIWLVVMWMVWMWLAFDTKLSHLRTRFFTSYMLVWMLGGSLLAIVFSSVGPCYYTNIGLSPDPYSGLMAYLNSANTVYPVEALAVQDMLWQSYTGEISIIAGISAMPSMHNATTLLFVLTVWPVSRKLGIVLALFAFVIFIGSIHLGWHYAIDTYLAYAVTIFCWWIAGHFATWHNRRAACRRFDDLLKQHSGSVA